MAAPDDSPLSDALVAARRNRRRRLAELMAGTGIDGLLVGHDKDIRYLTGFVGDDSVMIVTASPADLPVLITDARYDEFLDPWRTGGVAEVEMATRHRLEQTVKRVCERRGIKHLGLQAEHMTLEGHGRLGEACGPLPLVETSGLIARLRQRKDPLEVDAIERAIHIQQEALTAALQRLAVGMTEIEFCATLEYEMKSRGANDPSFATMVAGGARSSVIHYATGTPVIEEGTLLVDWGAVVDGYCSDMTRTFGVERMDDRIAELYAIVLEAQQAAIDACAPGRTCAEIDSVARGIITAAGHGEHFGHGLGHGLGLDIHEGPYFNEHATDAVLEPGMVMTVEPGIYVPGLGGVRIEDDVLITEGGCRVLCDYPKDPTGAVLEVAVAGGPAA